MSSFTKNMTMDSQVSKIVVVPIGDPDDNKIAEQAVGQALKVFANPPAPRDFVRQAPLRKNQEPGNGSYQDKSASDGTIDG